MDDVVERVARQIAEAQGDNFADAFRNKQRWIAKRGMSGGRFRDINEPFQSNYVEAAKTAIRAMLEGLEQDLALTELANIEGASDEWLEGFRAAVARLSAIKEAVK